MRNIIYIFGVLMGLSSFWAEAQTVVSLLFSLFAAGE